MNDTAFADAMAHHQAGRFDAAAAAYRAILDRNPEHADSLHLLGLIAVETDDPAAGIALIRRAMALEPGFAPHHNSLGHAFRRLGRLDDAVREYQDAAVLRPGSAEIHNNLATTLCDLGRREEAVEHYRRAAAVAPDVADIWYNLANILTETEASAEADVCYRTAIGLQPGLVHAHANYGRWLVTQGRWADADTALTDAVRLAPMQAANWNNLGVVRRELGRFDAEACFRQALAVDPKSADAYYNLGCLLFSDGRTDEAIACHQAALSADPGFGPARLAACMAQLPILYQSEAEIAVRRQRYAEALQSLGGADLAAAIGDWQPFFLPYQGLDDRVLQAAYGKLACRALAEPAAPLASAPAQGKRIRLGIVSGFFADHTLFKLFLEAWLTKLDRARFEVIGFHTGRIADAQTACCAVWCDRFVQGLPSGVGWREAIVAAAPHVLLYPEVGIDPVAGRLAAQRLAPVQCATWGQPETTGMPTIDAFLSSELMEPPDGDTHYTERLVRLPNLGFCYAPDETAPSRLDRAMLGLDPTAPVFWSGQALYKYLPQHDAVFPRIAAQLGRCQFVFIAFAKSPAVTEAFRLRLWDAFSAAGLDAAAHVVILPAMSQSDYLGSVGLADVILDTPEWSGGKSTLDCLAWDPAIVTLPGRFMRGRHTAAILRRIGCEATIAGSLDEYVSIAVRLGRDPIWRAEVRQAVARGKHRAFNDIAYVRALEAFLTDAVARIP
jgi:protein O-GlcNAc transferase